MGTIVPSVRHAAPGEEIRIGGVVTYVALWHGAVGYIDLVVATDGRRYAVRVASPHTGGARWRLRATLTRGPGEGRRRGRRLRGAVVSRACA